MDIPHSVFRPFTMISKTVPDEKLVYLALKGVFKGANSTIRHPRLIRELITQNKYDSDVADLIKSYPIDKIYNTAHILLAGQVFESTNIAKARFPEMFNVLPARRAEREAAEAEGAKADAEAIRAVAYPELQEEPESKDVITSRKNLDLGHSTPPRQTEPLKLPSLFPAYLTHGTKHRLLVQVQTILERACFNYIQKNLPDILKNKQWSCPESGDLLNWLAELYYGSLKSQLDVASSLERILPSLVDIRYCVIHRISIRARRIAELLSDAKSLAKILGESTCAESLETLRSSTCSAIEELEQNKHFLSLKLARSLEDINAKRAELDHRERKVVAQVLHEDIEYQVLAGKDLEQIM